VGANPHSANWWVAPTILLMALAQPAGAFELAWPVDCTLGNDCHIQQYFDHDAGPLATDFTCGPLSYDGHDGTDIAVSTRAKMAEGVAVLAAAPGVVKGVRDGVEDFVPFVEGRECGNGVLIEHDGGWQTQYCHLRQGSISVAAGDRVEVGTQLGLVGQSGMADFPHLHLSVRQNGAEVDPFEPDDATCSLAPGPTLWAEPIIYEPGGILEAGFADRVPEFDEVRAGLPGNGLPETAPGLVMWVYVFGTRAGDQMAIAITGPEGEVIRDTVTFDKTQAQAFRAIGKRLTVPAWPVGTYSGSAVLIREGKPLDQADVSVQITR
jgi:hypothetical protein